MRVGDPLFARNAAAAETEQPNEEYRDTDSSAPCRAVRSVTVELTSRSSPSEHRSSRARRARPDHRLAHDEVEVEQAIAQHRHPHRDRHPDTPSRANVTINSASPTTTPRTRHRRPDAKRAIRTRTRANTAAATEATHRTCWRSSPRARTKRTTSATKQGTMPISTTALAAEIATSVMASSAGTPNGLATRRPEDPCPREAPDAGACRPGTRRSPCRSPTAGTAIAGRAPTQSGRAGTAARRSRSSATRTCLAMSPTTGPTGLRRRVRSCTATASTRREPRSRNNSTDSSAAAIRSRCGAGVRRGPHP